MLGETKCPICGKTFFKYPQHVYKYRDKNKLIHVCSWTCLNKGKNSAKCNYDCKSALVNNGIKTINERD